MEASKISCLQVDEQLDSVQFSLTNVVERYVIDEPPEDAQAVLKRQPSIDNLLGHFRQHLQERSAHHLGKLLPSSTCLAISMDAEYIAVI